MLFCYIPSQSLMCIVWVGFIEFNRIFENMHRIDFNSIVETAIVFPVFIVCVCSDSPFYIKREYFPSNYVRFL